MVAEKHTVATKDEHVGEMSATRPTIRHNMLKKYKLGSRTSVTCTVQYGHAHLATRACAPGDEIIFYSNCAVTIQSERSCVTVRPAGVMEQYVARPAGKAVIQDAENFGLLAEFDVNTICPVFHEMERDDSLFEPSFSFSFSGAEVKVAFEITEEGDKIVYIKASSGTNRVSVIVKVCECMSVHETEGASRCESEEFSGWMCKSELISEEVQGHPGEEFYFHPIQ